MASSQHEFSQRLHISLDLAGVGKRGRTGHVAARFDVSDETARKWLGGLCLPTLSRMLDLAHRLGVSFEWLATGRGTPTEYGKVQDVAALYHIESREQSRLIGLIGNLPREQRKAMLLLLEHLAERD
ncbi:DNA-binding protein [Dyella tabacisoli]|uniref:DNA-binding protein n=1 Tax=Dyella tabacisoli TaxID=2282381 RepID=A0A369UX45_9GAMM|nr:DNA-binding protein [Dyella tabacisoli]RDD82899.1 DNA-binding protein [Dyella tabacisoli]